MLAYIKTVLQCSLLISGMAVANMPRNGFNEFVSEYFVETGTYKGHSLQQALNAGFKTIHSIEIDTRLAHTTTTQFQNHHNVHVWQGDSGSILYDVIEDIKEPITFWLDACSSNFLPNAETNPILRELDEIKRHPIKTHTILIDDMHCLGGPLFDFLSKESLIAKIKEINPNYVIRYVAGGDDGEYPNNVMVAQVPEYKSPYLDPHITNKINKDLVNNVVEIGAYNGLDSVALHDYYQCQIISFECAPESIKKCRTLFSAYPRIKLIEKAVWDATKEIPFYYCSEHPAASSCYLFDYEKIASRNRSVIAQELKTYPIKGMKVLAIRLDDWLRSERWLTSNEYNQIDLICMSPQGSIMPILRGLGSYLDTVKYVVTQVMYQRIYQDEALFPEVNEFMQQHGFTAFNQDPEGFFNTVVFVRNDLIS